MGTSVPVASKFRSAAAACAGTKGMHGRNVRVDLRAVGLANRLK